MTKKLMAFAMAATLLIACETKTEKQETTVTETTVTEMEPADTAYTEVETTTLEIEEASAKVDSLLNEI